MSDATAIDATAPSPSGPIDAGPRARATGCPDDFARLAELERSLLDRFARAGYEPMRTPVLEFTELHERKSGAGIVSKLFELAGMGTGQGGVCLRGRGCAASRGFRSYASWRASTHAGSSTLSSASVRWTATSSARWRGYVKAAESSSSRPPPLTPFSPRSLVAGVRSMPSFAPASSSTHRASGLRPRFLAARMRLDRGGRGNAA